MIGRFRGRIAQEATTVYQRVNQRTGGLIDLVRNAVIQFNNCNSSLAAAGIAFYAIFSLFPLLAILVTILTLLVPREIVVNQLLNYLVPILPFAGDLISENLVRFLEVRSAFGIIGTLSLLWSASNVFTILSYYINLAWERAKVRSFLQQRLVALGVIAGVIVVLIVALVSTSALKLATSAGIPITGETTADSGEDMIPRLINFLQPMIIFAIFFLVYRWFPNTRVKNNEAFWAALVVTVMLEIIAGLFGWYIQSGMVNYDLIYGSLAAVAVLLLWFYLNSVLVLFGAHLSASIAQREMNQKGLVQHTTDPSIPNVSGDKG